MVAIHHVAYMNMKIAVRNDNIYIKLHVNAQDISSYESMFLKDCLVPTSRYTCNRYSTKTKNHDKLLLFSDLSGNQ